MVVLDIFGLYIAVARGGVSNDTIKKYATDLDQDVTRVAERFNEYLFAYAEAHPDDFSNAEPSQPVDSKPDTVGVEMDEPKESAAVDAEKPKPAGDAPENDALGDDAMEVDETADANDGTKEDDDQHAGDQHGDAGDADDEGDKKETEDGEKEDPDGDERKKRGPGRPPGSGGGRGRGRGRGSGRGRGTGRGSAGGDTRVAKPRGRPKRSRVKVRTPLDFTVGCKVAVFWPKDNAWFSGTIEDQQGEGDLVMSKVQYDDGDVEVIDLFGGTQKVRLMVRADGAQASDADEPLEVPRDSEDEGDGGTGSRLRQRNTDGTANPESARRGPGRPRGRPAGHGQSRRSQAKDDSPPERAPGADPGLSDLGNDDGRERRRNPARVAAMHAMDTDGVNYEFSELPPEEEFPVTDEKILSVLAMMQSNETARALADLPEDPEPSGEVFRLGYKMGVQRALKCAAAVIAAAAARAPALKPADINAEAVQTDGNATKAKDKTPVSPPRLVRARQATAKAVEAEEARKAKTVKDGDDVNGDAANSETCAACGRSGPVETPSKEQVEADAAKKALEEKIAKEESDTADARDRGSQLRATAASDGGSWSDPIASASLDPSLASVLSAVERIIAEEVYNPRLWEEEEDDDADVAAALAKIHPDAATLVANSKIDANVVAGVLGVDAANEANRQKRGLSRGIEQAAFAQIAAALQNSGINVPNATGVKPEAGKKPGKTPGPGRPADKPTVRPPKTTLTASAAILMTPEEVIAAAYAEAQEKRDAAEQAIAAIGDLQKIAQVREDALKSKPTTTAGRLIKAANNADLRAEKIKAGGGGDGRALRVQGVRKSSGGVKTPGSGSGKPGRPPGSGSQKTTRPSEALLMERNGEGTEAFEFAPPLFKTPQAVAAEAYKVVSEETKGEEGGEEERDDADAEETDTGDNNTAGKEGTDLKESDDKDTGDGKEGTVGDKAKKRKRVSSDADTKKQKPKLKKKKEKVGAAGWGDGGRELVGDPLVKKWLEQRGWGEYAAAFAGKKITIAGLKKLSMQDIEQVPVEGEDVRVAIFQAAQSFVVEKESTSKAKKTPAKKTPAKEKAPKKTKETVSKEGEKGKGSSSDGAKRKRAPSAKASV